jgi:GNAT superfamily N-acetyltransferase
MALEIRPARPDDLPAFIRLFAELGVDDPVPSAERFTGEFVHRMRMAERAGEVVGYAIVDLLDGVAYVRHLVSAPSARRTGVGRALLLHVAAEASARGATRWVLNVKPDNVAAIALYESLGFRPTQWVHAMYIGWEDAVRAPRANVEVSVLPPEEDAATELATNVMNGHLGTARALGGRMVLVARERGTGRTVGVSVYDPGFPGLYPFQAKSPGIAFALLAATRPYAPPDHEGVNMKLDDLEAVKDAVLAAGGRKRLEVRGLSGPLPLA